MSTGAGEVSINELMADDLLTEDQWIRLIDIVEHQPSSPDAHQLLRALTLTRLDELFDNYPALGNQLGRLYSDWIRDGAFNFDDCDGLANRLERIFNQAQVDVKAEALMALLYMGTNHNRWYVERKFISLSGSMDELLAKRLAIEFRADDRRACKAVEHLEWSININRSVFNPVLKATLQQMCAKE